MPNTVNDTRKSQAVGDIPRYTFTKPRNQNQLQKTSQNRMSYEV